MESLDNGSQLFHGAHGVILQLFDIDFGVVFLDGVVGEVGVFVAQFAGVVFLEAEAAVELPVKPDLGWGVVLDQHPLSDVEFAPVYYQRVLYVFLDNVLRLLA